MGQSSIELSNRKRRKTRTESADSTFEYFEIFRNRQRWHSALGMLTPIEFENVTRHTSTGSLK
ncbi:IS3 family transposase [Rhodococcus sp. NPDC056516]|uniref:IS3 family transposase n=1 Tax=Rhodococcus sp. NPDC056516 TaxID=3345847 RepID=UPI00366E6A46